MRGKRSVFPASGANGLITDALTDPLRHFLVMSLDFRFEIDNDDVRIRFVERGPNPVGLCSFFIE